MIKGISKIKEIYAKVLKMLGFNEDEIYYIAGNDKLPPPLDEKEEQKLLERLMEKDKSAKDTLIERNLRLVVYIAKKFENSGVNIEDLISIGTIGLMKAINSYNLEKNMLFSQSSRRGF